MPKAGMPEAGRSADAPEPWVEPGGGEAGQSWVNWERELAAALEGEDEALVHDAERAWDLCLDSRYGAALGILWDLLQLARQGGSPRKRAFVFLHMGEVYRNWMYDVAFKFFREALREARADGFRAGEMVACAAIAGLYRGWREPDRALPWCRRCHRLAEECADPACRREALLELIECLRACGDHCRSAEMEKRLRELDRAIGTDWWSIPGGDWWRGEGERR